MDKLALKELSQLSQFGELQKRAIDGFTQFGQALATLLSGAELAPIDRAELHDQLSGYTADLERMKDVVRGQVLESILRDGAKVTEAGTMELRFEVAGQTYTKRAVPMRTSLDPRKLESLLRMRGVPVEHGMSAKLTYEVDLAKVEQLRTAGVLSESDIARCKYELSYKVSKLTAAKEDTNNE